MPTYTVVLTGPYIDPAQDLITPIIARTGGSEPTELARGTAMEWNLDIDSDDVDTLLADLRMAVSSCKTDLNIVPCDRHRRKRLLIADMDSTIIEQECIDEIATFSGHSEAVASVTERAMRGEIDFEGALAERVAYLEGLDEEKLDAVIRTRLKLTLGARTLVQTMAANGAYCALVSGGFTFFTSKIARMVGFHENRANTLEIADGRLTGRVVPPILGRQAKLDALREIMHAKNIPSRDTLAVGDGANDLDMIRASGLGVAFRAKPVVAAEAHAQIDHSDLTALLFLQGYRATDFVGC